MPGVAAEGLAAGLLSNERDMPAKPHTDSENGITVGDRR